MNTSAGTQQPGSTQNLNVKVSEVREDESGADYYRLLIIDTRTHFSPGLCLES